MKIACFCVLWMFLSTPFGAGEETTTAGARAKAVQALDGGRPAEAVSILESALKNDPGAVELLELLGTAYLRSGDEPKAKEAWERVLRAFPDRHNIRLWHTQLLERQGDYPGARAQYKDLVGSTKGVPDNVVSLARLGLARIALAEGEPAEAQRVLEPLLKQKPSAEAVVLQVRALEEDGKLDAAIELARRSQDVMSDGKTRLASLLHKKGLDAYRNDQMEPAANLLREAATLHPSPAILRDLAHVLAVKGERVESVGILQSLLKTQGPVESVAAPLGELLIHTGKPADALALARSSLEKSPDARFARILELRALAALDRSAETLARVKDLMAAHGSELEWVLAVLSAMELVEHPLELAEYWLATVPTTPLQGNPSLVKVLRKAGRQAVAANDTNRARGLFMKALEIAPDDRGARRDLGWVEYKAGNAEGVLKAWEPLLATSASDIEILKGTVQAFRTLGRSADAIVHLRRALEQDPKHSSIRKLYWLLLDEAGRTEELLRALDPDRLPQMYSEDGVYVARIMARHLNERPFRELLRRWRQKLPDDKALRLVDGRLLADEAKEARAAKDLKRAISLYRSSIELDPSSAPTLRGLGFALRAAGDRDGAVEAFRKASELDPKNLDGLAVLVKALRERGLNTEARQVIEKSRAVVATNINLLLESVRLAYVDRRFEEAAAEARILLEKKPPDDITEMVMVILANSLTELGKFDETLVVLKELCIRNPKDASLHSRFHQTALYAGKREVAVQVLQDLKTRFPDRWEPYPALIEDAVTEGDLERARTLLEEYLKLRPNDVSMWNLLGDVNERRSDLDGARAAYQGALSVFARDQRAHLGLAYVELNRKRYEDALAVCDSMLAVNPNHYDAHIVKINVLESAGEAGAALDEWGKAEQLFPLDINLLLLRGRVLGTADRFNEAADHLRSLLEWIDEGTLPVLLYHSISLYFEPESLPAALFRDQMKALQENGYTAVGLDDVERWLVGQQPLPPKPILITFDDARIDNQTVADPILAEFGYRAVEFVITSSVAEGHAFYLSWSDLRKLRETGRWEFGSHCHEAHRNIRVDAAGNNGNFLSSRRWLPAENRLETREEMEQRIRDDYALSAKKLQDELGVQDVAAVAFPYGSIGQKDLSNEPQAFALNLRAFKEHFQFGFHQSSGMYNLRDSVGTTTLLSRFPVPENWNGERLIRYLGENDPRMRARLLLARILSWSGRYADALAQLDEAAKLGAPSHEVLDARAHILMWQGDRLGSEATFRQLLMLDPANPRALEGLGKLERYDRPTVSVGLEWWQDSNERRLIRERNRIAANALPWLRLHGEAGYATYKEEDVEDVEGIFAEVGALASFKGQLELEGAFGATWFDPGEEMLQYLGAARWKRWDFLGIEAGATGGPVETASAILADVRLDAQFITGSVWLSPEDNMILSYRNGFYSDENRRDTFRGELSHQLLEYPVIRIGYRGTYDNAEHESGAYYAPSDVITNEVFLRGDAALAKRLRLSARVAGGYGWEDGDGRAVGEGSLTARWLLRDWLDLHAGGSYYRNPLYWRADAEFGLTIKF